MKQKQSPLLFIWEADEYHPIFLGVFASVKTFLKAYVARAAKRETFYLTRYNVQESPTLQQCYAIFTCERWSKNASSTSTVQLSKTFDIEEVTINKVR